MTELNLVVIKDKKLKINRVHYREAIRIIKNRLNKLNSKEVNPENNKKNNNIDGGYIILDMDNKTIINNQICFSIYEDVGNLRGFDIHSLN